MTEGLFSSLLLRWFPFSPALISRLFEPVCLKSDKNNAITSVASVTAIAGKGLQGDRHFSTSGALPGDALTLIEAEALEDVGLTGAESRRQLVVRGVRLNDLVGKRFRVGDVECLGVKLCEPCLHLQQLTRPGIIKDLIHRGGLNADILVDGQIRIGDPVSVPVAPASD